MQQRTLKASCLLNPFPTSGKEKSLCMLEPRIEGSQKWRLDAVLEITSCVFSFPLEPRVDFSVQLRQWGNVLLFLEFLDSLPSTWLCLNAFWGNASSLKTQSVRYGGFWGLEVISSGHYSLPNTSLPPPPHTKTLDSDDYRWWRALLSFVFLERIFQTGICSCHRCALAQRFKNVPWHLDCILIFLVWDDSPAKQFMYISMPILACRHPRKLFWQAV